MVVFEKLGINFVHAPKTGGSAVCRALATLEGNVEEFDRFYALRRQGEFHLTGLHSPCDKEMPGTTVCFTREPGSLAESCYNYARFRGFWMKGADAFLDELEKGRHGNAPVPAAFYTRYGLHGYEAHCNFIGRFENIEEDFDRLTGTKGVLKVWNRIPKSSIFSEAQLGRARSIWK